MADEITNLPSQTRVLPLLRVLHTCRWVAVYRAINRLESPS